MDDRRKRIKKYAFSNENTIVWMGPYNHGNFRKNNHLLLEA